MYQMVVLVMDELEKVSEVMDAWQEVGVSGITVWDSRGLGRTHHENVVRNGVPLMPSMDWFMKSHEEEHRTIFTLVDNEAMVDRLIEETEKITGGLDGPNRGILFVLPVLRAVGVLSSQEGTE